MASFKKLIVKLFLHFIFFSSCGFLKNELLADLRIQKPQWCPPQSNDMKCYQYSNNRTLCCRPGVLGWVCGCCLHCTKVHGNLCEGEDNFLRICNEGLECEPVTLINNSTVGENWSGIGIYQKGYRRIDRNAMEHEDALITSNGKKVVPLDKYPWMVSIKTIENVCGGALISKWHIITAAHCLDELKPDDELSHSASDTRKDKIRQVKVDSLQVLHYTGNKYSELKISNGYIHPNFSLDGEGRTASSHNDIAILKLKVEVQFSKPTRPIFISKKPLEEENREVIIAGWGSRAHGNSNEETELREISMRMMSRNDCAKAIKKIKGNPEKTLCSIGRSQGACYGDSGSPLFTKKGDLYYLTGIAVDVEDPNCSPEYATISTRIFSFIPWIKKHVKRLHLVS